MKIENPFQTSVYLGPAYFCNRNSETKTLTENLKNGLSTTVIAIRRMGKTGLLHHVLRQLPKSYIPVYFDILATSDKKEFLNVFTSAVANAVPEQSTLGQKIWKYIKSLRPVITYDPNSGIPQVSIEGTTIEIENDIKSVLTFLESLDKKIVIVIDEFQQILEYPEKNMDAWLRSIIQTLKNVVFVFSGSKKHIMAGLFTDPAKPFYRSTQILHFHSIRPKYYKEFISHHFIENKKIIEDKLIDKILDWTNLHTYYVQLVCNRLFLSSGKKVTTDDLNSVIQKLIKEQEIVFFQYRDLLTKLQWRLVVAMGKEGETKNPTSMRFIQKYKLGNPATVLRSLNSLENKEMIYHIINEDSTKSYYLYDVLLRRWVQSKF